MSCEGSKFPLTGGWLRFFANASHVAFREMTNDHSMLTSCSYLHATFCMTHTLIPISKSHNSDTTSNVYSVLNRTKCLSCHSVWSVAHIGEGEPGGFLRTTPPAIFAAERGLKLSCAVLLHPWRKLIVTHVTWQCRNLNQLHLWSFTFLWQVNKIYLWWLTSTAFIIVFINHSHSYD